MNQQKILEYSFGYDMTINEYYKVLSENGKTAVVQKIGRTVSNDEGRGAGRSLPDVTKVLGEPFRAYIRKYDDHRQLYVSKYFSGGYHTEAASEWDGTPSYYNTWD